VEWESAPGAGVTKPDPSLKTFVFTLKNPHNFPPRKFALKVEKKDKALSCCSSRGPWFYGPAIGIYDHCNAHTHNGTYLFSFAYTNDTGLDGNTFFTGSEDFKVKEIEVFEITDETTPPNATLLDHESLTISPAPFATAGKQLSLHP
jgi:hypothetical protein